MSTPTNLKYTNKRKRTCSPPPTPPPSPVDSPVNYPNPPPNSPI